MKLTRSVALALTTAVAVLVPTAAQANSWNHADGTGDVYTAPYNTTALTPAPTRTVGDVVGSTIRHKRSAVVLQLRYLDLQPSSEFNSHVFVIRTPSMRRVVTLVGNSAFPGGRVRMTAPNRPRKAIACRIAHRIDYTAKSATVVVPRSCLGKPRWVQVAMAGVSFTGFTGSDTMWVDDALSNGTSGIYSPRVFR